MSGMVTYTAKRGFDLSTVLGAVLASLADTTEETIGVDETTEIITNGTNLVDTTGWNAGTNTTLSAVSNRLRVASTANGSSWAYQSFTTVVGSTYVVSVDFDTDAVTGSTFILVGTSSGGSNVYNFNAGSTTGTKTFVFRATETTTYLSLYHSTSALAGEYSEFNNISVKLSGNLVHNHTFDDNTGSVGWTFDTNWSISNRKLNSTGSNNGADAEQTVNFTSGLPYVVTITLANRTSGSVYVLLGGTIGNGGVAYTANGTYTTTIIAGSTSSLLEIRSGGGGYVGDVDDISVRLAVPDLSIYGDGLEVHGQITKSAVNTYSELVGFSGFNTYNKIIQPYNSNADPGTNGFSGKVWFKAPTTPAGNDSFFYRIDPDNTANGHIIVKLISDGTLYFSVNDGTSGRDLSTTTNTHWDGLWHLLVYTFDGSTLKLYVDKYLDSSTTGTALLTLDNSGAKIYWGSNYSGGESCENTMIALGVFYPSVVFTSQQIVMIYDNESHLFNKYQAFTQIGEQYSLHLDLSGGNPNVNEIKRINTPIDGPTEVITLRDDEEYSAKTGLIHKTDPTAVNESQFKEFMFSTRAEEVFTFDPDAPAGGEDNPIQVTRISRNYTLSRVNDSTYFESTFRVKAA